ncbi:MAG: anaerobic ribonucleoside-triphosphate reductase, partial [Bacilli bacterium]|nr:anaerobic ribonucleoside-triphosphate reductase [Bacilli bacterium]
MQVEKRDGSKVNYDLSKITQALIKVNNQVGELTDEDISRLITIINNKVVKLKEPVSVESIQDIVEDTLMKNHFYKTAKSYILYRDNRTRIRENKSKLFREIATKINASNVINQNANVDEKSFGGRKGEASNELLKEFALNNCMSKKARENHLGNRIYIHDLDSYALGNHNCLSIPFDDLLKNGFNTRQTDVRPANSVNTAFQLIAVIFQLQSLQQFGGVSATHLDWSMVPYVKKSFYKHYKDGLYYIENSTSEVGSDETSIIDDCYKQNARVYKFAYDMTVKEINQAVEGMYHNLNTLQSRSGNQLPFTSINYGTCMYKEGQLITEALLKGSIKGVGKVHKTAIFPCGIFQYMKGVNDKPNTPNYFLKRLALESTAKRLYPNYANVDWSGNYGYDKNDPRTYFSTMGCRTANGADINAEPGVNPQIKDGRGNLAPVTIILPTLAMEAGRDVEKFMEILDKAIYDAKDMLLERYEYMCAQDADSAKFMYENNLFIGYHPEEGIRSALRHGTLVIGQIAMAETLQLLVGCNQTKPEGMELAKRIEQLFKDRCAQFKQEYKLNFGVYYTPAENLCYTAMTKFKKQYGEIENVSDRDYFTNSIHIPVWENVNAFEKINLESQLTGYSNAGCITYVELDSAIQGNLEALEAMVDYAMEKDIPYFAVNVPCDECLDCG